MRSRMTLATFFLMTACLHAPAIARKAKADPFIEIKSLRGSDNLYHEIANTVFDLSPGKSGVLDFAIPPDTSALLASLALAGSCRSISYELNYRASSGVEYPAMRTGATDQQPAQSQAFSLPPGNYRVRAQFIGDRPCKLGLSIRLKSTVTDTDAFGRETAEFIRTGQEALTNKVKLGLILRGKGDFIDIDRVSVTDKNLLIEHDRQNASAFSKPYSTDEIYIDVIRYMCGRLQLAQDLSIDVKQEQPAASLPWQTSASEEQRDDVTQLLGIGFARAYVAETGLKLSGRYQQASIPDPAGPALCRFGAVSFPKLVSMLQGPRTPQYMVRVHRSLPGNLQTVTAAISEILATPPANVVLFYRDELSGLCSGTIYIAEHPLDELGGHCLESGVMSVKIPRFAVAKPGAASIASDNPVTMPRVSAILHALLGASAKIEDLIETGAMLRVRVTNLKGALVQGGRDWETLYLTLVSSKGQDSNEISIIAEGMLASGLGSRVPPLSAFTRSMDVETPMVLQDFAGKFAVQLRKISVR